MWSTVHFIPDKLPKEEQATQLFVLAFISEGHLSTQLQLISGPIQLMGELPSCKRQTKANQWSTSAAPHGCFLQLFMPSARLWSFIFSNRGRENWREDRWRVWGRNLTLQSIQFLLCVQGNQYELVAREPWFIDWVRIFKDMACELDPACKDLYLVYGLPAGLRLDPHTAYTMCWTSFACQISLELVCTWHKGPVW